MTRGRAFWLSFFGTLAVLVPLYLAVFAYGSATTGARAAEKEKSGVWVAQATAADAQTVLVMTGGGTAQTAECYTLVRFDAYQNRIAVASMPPQTVVLIGGSPVTLAEAVQSAGPSQAVAALTETLHLCVDNYLFAAPKTLWQTVEAFGNITLRLPQYLERDAMAALGLTEVGGETQAVSPRLFAQILAEGNLAPEKLSALRARGYAAFLAAGHGRLKAVLPRAVRVNSTALATNLTAAQLYDYERTLQFLDQQEPAYIAEAMPGTWRGARFELNEESAAFVQAAFSGSAPQQAQAEDSDVPQSGNAAASTSN
ncbi:MAG: hypothetical protein RSE54_08275 [Ruthenibacterium sp.]